ncbi:MAG TPA: glutathione S-transferase N-terminal domain-containing protein [Thermoleophilaceae bacterium]
MPVKLYVIPASHPSRAAELMLERKGIPFNRVDLVSALHKPVLRALGFPHATVPAMKLDGRRIQGSRAIARALDIERPDPPLLPADPALRARVEEAECFGDEQLQGVPRRLAWWALKRDPSGVRSFLEGSKLPMPTSVAAATSGPIIAVAVRLNGATDEAVHADLAGLPGMLDRVDSFIEEGVIGGTEPNAADYQIATSVRLLMCFDDLRPLIETRPAGKHALALVPDFPGRMPPVFTPEQLALLGAEAA